MVKTCSVGSGVHGLSPLSEGKRLVGKTGILRGLGETKEVQATDKHSYSLKRLHVGRVAHCPLRDVTAEAIGALRRDRRSPRMRPVTPDFLSPA